MEKGFEFAPVESLESKLPYDSLISWESFENLCTDLMIASFPKLINVRRYLSRGYKQEGIDVRGYDPVDEKYIHLQAKKYTKFKTSDLIKASVEFGNGKLFDDCKLFVLAVSSSTINVEYEDELMRIEQRFSQANKKFVLWDSRALDSFLKSHPQIVFDHFDRGSIDRPFYVTSFNGTKALQDLIIRPKRKLYECPADYVSRLLLYEDESIEKKQSLVGAINSNFDNILLKSAATIGKTTELEYLAFYFSKEKTDTYFPILISLKNYVNQSIDELLKDNFDIRWKQVSPAQLLVILDGFDEVKSEERDTFLRHLEAFKVNNPFVRIVLSSRTNFITGSTMLEGFKSYTLSEFGVDEIQLFISKTLKVEHHQPFLEIIRQRTISHWINSPYNLSNFIELYKSDPSKLPETRVELIKSILELTFQRDFKRSRLDAVPQLQRRSVIQKLALSYNLCGVYSVTLEELCSIFDNEEVEIIRSTSFIKFSEISIAFNHNVLQEYLTARLLSTKTFDKIIEVICFKPSYQKIKPKWFNTVALLIDILSNNPQRLQKVVKFICEKEHTLLKEVEYSFFSTSLKREIFKIIAADSGRIYGHFLYEDKIAEICGLNEDEYILEHLLTIIRTADGYDLDIYLRVLMELEGDFIGDYESEIKVVIVSILDNKQSGNKTKSLVYRVLTQLRIIDSAIVDLSLRNLQDNRDYNLIDEVIGYLNFSPNHEDFIEVYLNVLSDWQQKKVIGITPNIFNGILQFKTPEALHKIINFLDDKKNKIFHLDYVLTQSYYKEEGFFKILAKNLSRAYKTDDTIFEKVLNFLKNVSQNGYGKEIKELFTFFFLTKTNEKAFWVLLGNKSGKYFQFRYTAALLLDGVILLEILKKLKEEEMQNDEVWEVIYGLNQSGKSTLSEHLRIEANKISDNYFQYKEEINYQAVRDERIRRDVELLTDIEEFKKEAIKVFKYYGKETLTEEEVCNYERDVDRNNNSVITEVLQRHCEIYSAKGQVNKAEIWNFLSQDELYVIIKLSAFKNDYLITSAIIYLQKWCNKVAKSLSFETAITMSANNKSWRYSMNEYYYSILFLKEGIEIPKEIQLKILSFDVTSCVEFIERDQDDSETITEKVIRLQGEDVVKAQLLKNFEDETISIVVLENHIEWCKRLRIEEALPQIIGIIKRYPQRESHSMSSMINTYCELGGDIRSFKFILEQFNRDIDFHWLVLQKMVSAGKFKLKIKKALLDHTNTNKANENLPKAANLLIEMGEVEGLNYFIKWYKAQVHLPDSWFSPDLVTFQFNAVFSMLYDLLSFVVGEKLDSTRGNNPIGEILKSLKPLAFRNEEDFMKCVTDFTSLANSGNVLEENIYSLRSGIYNFESEYYLEK